MRVIIAEDSALLRDSLSTVLATFGITVVAAVGTAVELLHSVRTTPDVDLVITDIRMPPTFTTEGMEATVDLRRDQPALPVLVLSQFVEQYYAKELIASGDGAVGYLLKDRIMAVTDFVDAARRVAAGGTVLDPHVVTSLLARADEPRERLTPREQDVLAAMAQGRSNAAIAQALVVTEKAVGKHITNIFIKLGLAHDPSDNRRVLAVLRYLQSL